MRLAMLKRKYVISTRYEEKTFRIYLTRDAKFKKVSLRLYAERTNMDF